MVTSPDVKGEGVEYMEEVALWSSKCESNFGARRSTFPRCLVSIHLQGGCRLARVVQCSQS